jgi:hypothetical protein
VALLQLSFVPGVGIFDFYKPGIFDLRRYEVKSAKTHVADQVRKGEAEYKFTTNCDQSIRQARSNLNTQENARRT